MNPVVKRIVTALAAAALVILGIICAPPAVIAGVVAVLAALAVAEYGMLLAKKVKSPASRMVGFFLGAAIILAGLSSLGFIVFEKGNLMLLYVVAIVKISDMGGFAFGMSSAHLMKGGNHKLCPTISPNKSWEGLFGSVFGSCLISCCLMAMTRFGWTKSLLLGAAAALVGTFGDLVESKFKRWVGVKDSSTMKCFNGLGGILDMLDSLLFAPFVLYFLIRMKF
ncbi:MAG: phosphatidate cytidylyltransferase [Kiritimatiellae bacterium]|nr:phosphatidate cytidylyltransferase [Kiritimatiellia bacterium]